MITGEFISTVWTDEDTTQLSSLFLRESLVTVEIPVRGLLLKEDIVICNCSQDHVEAQSSNISHFCTGSFNYPLFIRLDGDNKALMCRLSDLLVYSGKVILSDFQFIDQVWIDRQYERVQPKTPTFVSVKKDQLNKKANLFDLSQTGMCVLLEKSSEAFLDELMDSECQIQLKLPHNETPCTFKSRVVQSRPISNSLFRIGMDISILKKDEKKVAHYLSERKREILDELFLNFKELLNYRETKDLYF